MASRLLSITALMLVAPVARGEDALKVDVVPKALVGAGQPALVVKANQRLDRLTLDVRRSGDNKRLRLEAGPVLAGRDHRFELTLAKPGKARFTGTLSVEIGDQGGQMPIDVEVELLSPLEVTIARDDVDTKKRQLYLQADRDMKRVQVTVMSDTGTPMGTTVETFKGNLQPANTRVEVRYKQSKGRIMRITVQAWDADEFFGAVDLFPWQVDIPHEEVNFATGKSDIDATEAEKLDASYVLINAAIDKYGDLAKIRLFVAGHTDTVGDAASNRGLSNERARALGRWFRKRGVKIPILFAGFGEDALLVETPDNADEAKNRRAEYIVAVDPPALAGGARWSPL